MKKQRKKLLKLYRENTGGKTTYSPKDTELTTHLLVGWQRSRVIGITTFRSGCNYGA
jgi:hypothetical protein